MVSTAVEQGLRTVAPLPPTALSVTGTLPSYLAASVLYRIGPGRYTAPHSDHKEHTIRHWFDGFSTLHSFTIHDTTSVTYHSAALSEPLLRSIAAIPQSQYRPVEFARSDPCRSLLSKFFALWTRRPVDPVTAAPAPGNINVTVQRIPTYGIVARTDDNSNAKINPENLEVDQFFGFGQLHRDLDGHMAAAHGHYDEDTGEFFNYVYKFGGPTIPYRVFRVAPDGSTNVIATIRERPCYLHSFALTQKYIILCLWPANLSGVKVMLHKSVMDGITFRPDEPTKFYVVSRTTGNVVAVYSAPAFFCFHIVNAYDVADGIVIDLCRYNDTTILDHLMLDHMRSSDDFSRAVLARYELSALSAASTNPSQPTPASETILDTHSLELTRTNPRFLRRDYTFLYGVSGDQSLFSEIVKINVKTAERITWSMGECVVGEPIFVPDPNGLDEDDGCLLSVVLDAQANNSCMVVIDAKSMTEVARATVPQVVPLGFHGLFDQP